MSGGRNLAILLASVAAVLVVGSGIGYVNSLGPEAAGADSGNGVASGGSSERDELLAMVKERDDTIKNLREKLEEAYEGREIDVRAREDPFPSRSPLPFSRGITLFPSLSSFLLFMLWRSLVYALPRISPGCTASCVMTSINMSAEEGGGWEPEPAIQTERKVMSRVVFTAKK